MTDKSTLNQAETNREGPSLPTHRAFVVQFRRETDIERGPFEGRTEHVVSGQMTRFHSVEELLAFFASLLTAQDLKQDPKAVEDRHDA